MANGIFVPPWLKGVDPGELARIQAAGMEIGQRAAAQQNQALLAMQEVQQKQQEAAMRQRIAQQEIELETKKQQTMMAQFEQEQQLKRQRAAQEATVAAARFAGTRKYQDTFNALIAGGTAPDEARKQAMLEAAPLLLSQAPSQALATLRTGLPVPPPRVQTFGEGIPPAVINARGTLQWPPRPAAPATERLSQVQIRELDDLYRSKRQIQDSLQEEQSTLSVLKPGSPEHASTKAQVDMLRKQQADIESRIKTFGGGAKEAAPATASKAKQRADLANQLSKDHPDWTREQIIAEVRKQIL